MAFALAFLFGMLSSVGPCIATRLVVVTGVARTTRASMTAVIGAFLVGLLSVYVLFALAVHLIGFAQLVQSQVLGLAAVAFGIAGVVVFVQSYRDSRDHEHAHEECAVERKPQRTGILGAFGIGVLSAVNFSPCCTPWLLMALTYTSMQGNALYGAALMVVFGLGHAVPMLAYGHVAGRLATLFSRVGATSVLPLLNSAFLFCLAIYYGVQA